MALRVRGAKSGARISLWTGPLHERRLGDHAAGDHHEDRLGLHRRRASRNTNTAPVSKQNDTPPRSPFTTDRGVHTQHVRSANPEARSSECQETVAEGSSGRFCIKGYSSTYLAIGFANVRAGTQCDGRYPLGTRPDIGESHSEISTRVPFCIAEEGTTGLRREHSAHERTLLIGQPDVNTVVRLSLGLGC